MKKGRNAILLCLLAIPLFSSCSSAPSSPEPSSELDYSLYYSYKGAMKGVEVYCWKRNGAWESGILPGTNRQKEAAEVLWLQQNLPCPLEEMTCILSSYSSEDRESASLWIVSCPVKQEELLNPPDEQNFDYAYLSSQLGPV